MFDADVITLSVDRGDFKTSDSFLHSLPSCCGNTNQNTEVNECSVEKGRGYIKSKAYA